MSDNITIRPATGTWVVRAAGAVIAETKNALALSEGDYPPVIYIPRADIAMAFLDASETTSSSPHKGIASYVTVVAKSGPLADAGWSYEDPKDSLSAIKGHIAFRHEKVAVEQL
uniref:DUF427 domain-containing protein n=2 Tax=Yoonia sp. TaxID=2212373 RepID=UPI0040478687|tara:strand:- start:427 stop:768 length:342 start_codon:yes stop_codon:yes gene_type:complete